MLQFYKDVQIAYDKAFAKGIVDDTVQEIIETIMEQEVVTYATERGSITFDVGDVDWSNWNIGIVRFMGLQSQLDWYNGHINKGAN